MDDFDWGSFDMSNPDNYAIDSNFDSGWDNIVDSSTPDSSSWVDNTSYGATEAPGWDSGGFGNGTGSGGTDWTDPSAGTGMGGSSFPWTSALLQGGGAVLSGLGSMYKDKQDWKARTEYMKAQLAEQEKYYQLHGKQLADAYQGYKKFAGTQTNPLGGLLNSGGPSGYFH
jgi:hypothetical protein